MATKKKMSGVAQLREQLGVHELATKREVLARLACTLHEQADPAIPVHEKRAADAAIADVGRAFKEVERLRSEISKTKAEHRSVLGRLKQIEDKQAVSANDVVAAENERRLAARLKATLPTLQQQLDVALKEHEQCEGVVAGFERAALKERVEANQVRLIRLCKRMEFELAAAFAGHNELESGLEHVTPTGVFVGAGTLISEARGETALSRAADLLRHVDGNPHLAPSDAEGPEEMFERWAAREEAREEAAQLEQRPMTAAERRVTRLEEAEDIRKKAAETAELDEAESARDDLRAARLARAQARQARLDRRRRNADELGLYED